jgi:uncharacterized protein YjgD (DUF1641 family)
MTDTNSNIKDLVEQLGQPDTASHVQELLGQAGTLGDVTKVIQAYQNSQTDGMIERLASIMEPLGALANEVAKPEVFGALTESIGKITELHSSGALDALTQMATFATAAKNSMGDSVIERAASTMEPLGALANEVAKPEVSNALQDSIKVLTELHSSGSLDALAQMATFAAAAKNSMTDSLVERSCVTMEKLVEMGDEVAKADLVRMMPALQELIDSGSLEILTQMATFAGSATHAFTDSIVERMLTMFENLISRLMNPQIQELFGAMVEGAHDTMAEMKEEPYKQGMFGLLKTARDPEVQKSLQFAMNFSKNFHKSLTSVSGPKL